MRMRFFLPRDLVCGFSIEQLDTQIARMKSSGRYILPNNGGEYILRVGGSDMKKTGRDIGTNNPLGRIPAKCVGFTDFLMHGAEEMSQWVSYRIQWPGISTDNKLRLLAWAREIEFENEKAERSGKRDWWFEAGSWLCSTFKTFDGPLKPKVMRSFAPDLRDILIVCLQDRAVPKEGTEYLPPSKKWLASGLCAPQYEAHEITLRCPGAHRSVPQGGSHASPRMHYRAEHPREQPHGPGHTLRKTITIDAQWINARDIDPSELGTPISQNYKLVRD